jgi:hypothetical protein
LRVPPGYAGELADVIAYGATKGVKVEIKVFP